MRFTARETVAMDTPARLATSRMLTRGRRWLDGFCRGAFTVKGIIRFPVVSQSPFARKSIVTCIETVVYMASPYSGQRIGEAIKGETLSFSKAFTL
jgi:hypothetical protein